MSIYENFSPEKKMEYLLLRLKRIFSNPASVIVGMAAGCLIGVFDKELASKLDLPGNIFLSFLMMCTLPIVIAAVVSSLGKIFHRGQLGQDLKKVVVYFLLLLMMAALVSYFSTLVIRPGDDVSSGSRQLLAAKSVGDGSHSTVTSTDGSSILISLVPPNIFLALAENNVLGILCFSVLLGVAIGILRTKSGEIVINMMDSLFDAIQKVLEWGLLFLPLGLCCMLAAQVAKISPEMAQVMSSYLIVIYAACSLIIVFSLLVITRVSGYPFGRVVRMLWDMLTISFVTTNVFAAIPSALSGLKNLRLDEDKAHLVVPLATVLCNPGSVVKIVTIAVFSCFLYGVSPTDGMAPLLIVGGAILISFGAPGSGLAIYGMLPVVMGTLHVPSHAVIPLVIAVDYFVNPIISAADSMVTCTISAIIAGRREMIAKPEKA